MKTQLTGILLLFLTLTGCIKETLDKCPEGYVSVNVYAEKFQTNSAAVQQDAEEVFNKRIQYLHYILYKDNAYVLDREIADVSGATGPYCSFNIPQLAWGDYRLVVIANCPPDAMSGDIHTPGDLSLLYTGAGSTEDMFAATLDFTVDCDCPLQFETKLRRLQGVIRCQLKAVPAEVSEAEVIIHGVNSVLGKGGKYSATTDISKRVTVPAPSADGSRDINIILGAFPTPDAQPASYQLKLYTPSHKEAVFDEVITKEVKVERNQLVELLADFSDGSFSFEIKVDGKWEDYVNSGGIEME